MSPAQLTVTILGVAAIVFVLWYFLAPPPPQLPRPRAPLTPPAEPPEA